MATDSLNKLSIQELRRAIALKEQIEVLEKELGQIIDAPLPTRSEEGRCGKHKRIAETARTGRSPLKLDANAPADLLDKARRNRVLRDLDDSEGW